LQRVTTGALSVKFISKGKRSNIMEWGIILSGTMTRGIFRFSGSGKGDLEVEKNVVADEKNWELRAADAVFCGRI